MTRAIKINRPMQPYYLGLLINNLSKTITNVLKEKITLLRQFCMMYFKMSLFKNTNKSDLCVRVQ